MVRPLQSFFQGPIALALFRDAVVAPCGCTFSYAKIVEWIHANHVCPLHPGSALEVHQLVPHVIVRNAVEILLRPREAPFEEEDPDYFVILEAEASLQYVPALAARVAAVWSHQPSPP